MVQVARGARMPFRAERTVQQAPALTLHGDVETKGSARHKVHNDPKTTDRWKSNLGSRPGRSVISASRRGIELTRTVFGNCRTSGVPPVPFAPRCRSLQLHTDTLETVPRAHPAILAVAPFAFSAAISIGPTENAPALALSVSTRRYPPAELMC